MKAVQNDAGQAIGFGPNKATDVFVEGERLAHFEGTFEAANHEVEVQLLGAMREAARDDLGDGIVNSGPHGTVFKVLESDHVSGLGLAKGFLNLGCINPVVALKDS